jgi:hypothetical protein
MPDMFRAAHKALRAADARVLVALGTCAGDAAATATVLADLQALISLHRTHQHVEDQVIFPAIEARRPGTTKQLAFAHLEHTDVLDRLQARLDANPRAPDALHGLYLALSHYIAENALHMYAEETLLAPVLSEAYTPAELFALLARIPTVVSPTAFQLFSAAMMAAISPHERAQMQPPPR